MIGVATGVGLSQALPDLSLWFALMIIVLLFSLAQWLLLKLEPEERQKEK
jgi:uncharacterized membrane protein YoaK (UPF0700 family)